MMSEKHEVEPSWGERAEERTKRIARGLAKSAVYGMAVIPVFAIGSVVAGDIAERIYVQTHETPASTQLRPENIAIERAPDYDPLRLTLFASTTIRRDVGEEAADYLQPETDKHGRTGHIIYNPENVDPDEIATSIDQAIREVLEQNPSSGERPTIKLVVYAPSGGGKIMTEALEELLRNKELAYNVVIEILVLDAAPYDIDDIKNSVLAFLTEHANRIPGGRPAVLIGQVAANGYTYDKNPLSGSLWRDSLEISESGNMPLTGLKEQARAVRESVSDEAIDTLDQDGTRIVFIGSKRAEADTIVKVRQAAEKWQEAFSKKPGGAKLDISFILPGGHVSPNTPAYLDFFSSLLTHAVPVNSSVDTLKVNQPLSGNNPATETDPVIEPDSRTVDTSGGSAINHP